MFCEHCGAKIRDDSLFCERCGAKLHQNLSTYAPQPTVVMQAGNEHASEIHSSFATNPNGSYACAQNGSSRQALPVILIITATIAVITALTIFLVLPAINGNSADDKNNSTSSYQTEEATDSNKVDSSSSSTKSDAPKNTSPSVGTTESKDVMLPDEMGALTSASLRGSANLFLSNFTEVGLNNMSASSSADPVLLVSFAFNHDAINTPEYLEEVEGAAISTKRLAVQRIDHLTTLFFGSKVNYGEIDPYTYTVNSGYVYASTRGISFTSKGLACITGSENLGGNQVRYYFNVYKGNYDPTDSSIYSKTEDEIKSILGVSSPEYSGTAVVTTGGSSEVTDGMTLKSIERN